MEKREKKLLVLVYDGIDNSVFESQLWEPVLRKLRSDSYLSALVVTCELRPISKERLARLNAVSERLQIKVVRRLPFLGRASLWLALLGLKKLVAGRRFDKVMARGPLAGWLALKLKKNFAAAATLMVQARGLCAQELRYVETRAPSRGLKRLLAGFVQRSLERLESAVYGYRGELWHRGRFVIEAVSEALGEYLVVHFGADHGAVTLANEDLPRLLTPDERLRARAELRAWLGISPEATVYTYSGSFKAWQCARETVAEAAYLLAHDRAAHFVIFSLDEMVFKAAASAAGIDPARLHVLSVKSDELVRFLAVADFGLLLREADVINWVSRPTKALEYHAAGLTVLHNGTVGVLTRQELQVACQMVRKS